MNISVAHPQYYKFTKNQAASLKSDYKTTKLKLHRPINSIKVIFPPNLTNLNTIEANSSRNENIQHQIEQIFKS